MTSSIHVEDERFVSLGVSAPSRRVASAEEFHRGRKLQQLNRFLSRAEPSVGNHTRAAIPSHISCPSCSAKSSPTVRNCDREKRPASAQQQQQQQQYVIRETLRFVAATLFETPVDSAQSVSRSISRREVTD